MSATDTPNVQARPMYGFPSVGHPTFGGPYFIVTTEDPLQKNHALTFEVDLEVDVQGGDA